MRVTFLALLFATSTAAICQSAAPTSKTPDTLGEKLLGSSASTGCKTASADLSTLSSATPKAGDRSGTHRKWRGDLAQVNSSFSAPLPFSNFKVQPCTLLAQNEGLDSYQKQVPHRPDAKHKPIPTQWPDAGVKPIPTRWPNAKVVPVSGEGSSLSMVPPASQSRAHAPMQAPVK